MGPYLSLGRISNSYVVKIQIYFYVSWSELSTSRVGVTYFKHDILIYVVVLYVMNVKPQYNEVYTIWAAKRNGPFAGRPVTYQIGNTDYIYILCLLSWQ